MCVCVYIGGPSVRGARARDAISQGATARETANAYRRPLQSSHGPVLCVCENATAEEGIRASTVSRRRRSLVRDSPPHSRQPHPCASLTLSLSYAEPPSSFGAALRSPTHTFCRGASGPRATLFSSFRFRRCLRRTVLRHAQLGDPYRRHGLTDVRAAYLVLGGVIQQVVTLVGDDSSAVICLPR